MALLSQLQNVRMEYLEKYFYGLQHIIKWNIYSIHTCTRRDTPIRCPKWWCSRTRMIHDSGQNGCRASEWSAKYDTMTHYFGPDEQPSHRVQKNRFLWLENGLRKFSYAISAFFFFCLPFSFALLFLYFHSYTHGTLLKGTGGWWGGRCFICVCMPRRQQDPPMYAPKTIAHKMYTYINGYVWVRVIYMFFFYILCASFYSFLLYAFFLIRLFDLSG